MVPRSRNEPRDPYYLRNFHLLADAVLERDGQLFTMNERARLRAIRSLPDSARMLLLRLVGRRDGWFRTSRLSYKEIPSLDGALFELEKKGWLERWPGPPGRSGDPPPEMFTTVSHDECRHLLRLAGQPSGKSATRDRERLASLLTASSAGAWWSEVQLVLWPDGDSLRDHLAGLDQWVRLRHRLLFRLLELCFFGNRHQTLSQFVLTELGLQQFERVPCGEAGLFSNRAEAELVLAEGERLDQLLLDLDELRRLLKGWRKGLRMPPLPARRSRELLAIAWDLARRGHLPDDAPDSPQSGAAQIRRIRIGALLAGAATLERIGRPGAAAGWQRLALAAGAEGRRRGETWTRLVINLRHSGRRESADAACRQALAESLGPVSRHELSVRAGLAPHLREPETLQWKAMRHPGHQGGRQLLHSETDLPQPVEEWALRRLRAEGWQGLHAENHLFRALVGLAAWDLVFAPVPGAFRHRFQAAPLDWGRPGFLERRADHWRRLRTRLRRERHHAGVRRRLRSKAGLLNPLFSWSNLLDAESRREGDAPAWRRGLEVLLGVLPGCVLAEAAERLLEHPSECGHGLPDLLLWREDDAGVLLDWRLVEVKGPGDRLFLAQKLWLDWLLERGLPVEVLVVGESEAR